MLRNLRLIRNLHCYCRVTQNNVSKISCLNLSRACGYQNVFFHSVQFQNNLSLISHHPRRDSVRHKSKNKGKKQTEEDSDEEFSDDEEVFKEGDYDDEGGRVKRFRVKSLRMDQVVKSGFRLTRRRFDEALFANKIRINGTNISKKSYDVKTGDVFEMYEESTDGDVNNKTVAKFTIKKIVPLSDPISYFIFVSYSTD